MQRLPRLSEAKIADLDNVYSRQAEALLAVDELVGALVETLVGTGELGNTYIIFTSDQGFHMGEHRLSETKRTPYAATTQIPLIIRGPGVPEGAVREALVLNTDIAPTIAGLVGAPVPGFVDGRTLQPLWEAAVSAGADIVLNAHDHHYERFEALDADGDPRADGTVEFVSGNGGHHLRDTGDRELHSAAVATGVPGVLFLEFRADGYDWTYTDVEGRTGDEGARQLD